MIQQLPKFLCGACPFLDQIWEAFPRLQPCFKPLLFPLALCWTGSKDAASWLYILVLSPELAARRNQSCEQANALPGRLSWTGPHALDNRETLSVGRGKHENLGRVCKVGEAGGGGKGKAGETPQLPERRLLLRVPERKVKGWGHIHRQDGLRARTPALR